MTPKWRYTCSRLYCEVTITGYNPKSIIFYGVLPLNTEKSCKVKVSLVVGCGLVVLLACVAIMIALYMAFPHRSSTYLTYEEVTSYLQKVDPLVYSKVIITEDVQQDDSEHVISVAIPPCDTLRYSVKNLYYMSEELEEKYPTRLLGLFDFVYAIPPSLIQYSICLQSNLSEFAAVEFYIYDDFDSFLQDDVRSSVYNTQLNVNNKSETCYNISFSVTKAAFYFFSGKSQDDISYVYTVTGSISQLDLTDYEEHCRVSASKQCSISLPVSTRDHCVLVYPQPLSIYDSSPLISHLKVEVTPRFEFIVVFPLVCILFSFLAMVIAIVVMFCVHKHNN